jgi:hypothetical protein
LSTSFFKDFFLAHTNSFDFSYQQQVANVAIFLESGNKHDHYDFLELHILRWKRYNDEIRRKCDAKQPSTQPSSQPSAMPSVYPDAQGGLRKLSEEDQGEGTGSYLRSSGASRQALAPNKNDVDFDIADGDWGDEDDDDDDDASKLDDAKAGEAAESNRSLRSSRISRQAQVFDGPDPQWLDTPVFKGEFYGYHFIKKANTEVRRILHCVCLLALGS